MEQYNASTRVELIYDDDDDDTLEFLPVTFHAETGKPYAMRHYRI